MYYRVLAASAIAAVVAWCTWQFLSVGRLANDFQWPYAAALELRKGNNPYHGLLPGVPIDFYTGTDPLFYPLPAVMVALPLSYLSPVVAGVLFSSLSAWLLAFGLTAEGEWWRLGTFLAAPAWIAFGNVQWAPLLLASVFLWWLSPLQVCKPSLGLAAFAARPRLYGVVVAGLVSLGSLLLLPSWPIDWLRNLSETHHQQPALYAVPGLLLLSVVAAHRLEGRLFLAWSLVPGMVFFYDSLLLWAIPRRPWQLAALTVLSWVAVLQWQMPYGELEKTLEYTYIALPAFGLVLYQRWRDA